MMKRITTIMLILCAVFAFSLAVSAEITADEISELFYLDSDDELLQMYVDGLPEDVKNGLDTTKAHLGYCLTVDSRDFKELYGGSIISLLDEKSDNGEAHNYPYIYIPFVEDGKVVSQYSDLYLEETLKKSPNDNDYRVKSYNICFDPEKIAELLNTADVGSLKYITEIEITQTSFELIYVETDKGNYIIPLDGKMQSKYMWEHIEKGNVCTEEAFMDAYINEYVPAAFGDYFIDEDGERVSLDEIYDDYDYYGDEENPEDKDAVLAGDEKAEDDIEDKKPDLDEEPAITVEATTNLGEAEHDLTLLSEDEAELVVIINDYNIRKFDVELIADEGIKTNVIVKYKPVVLDATMVVKKLCVYGKDGKEIEGIACEKNCLDYNFTVSDSVRIEIFVVPVSTKPLADRPDNAEILVNVNGRVLDFDVKPVLENDRTLVPLRGIFEALGAEVSWDDETWTVTAVRGDVTVRLTIGEKVLYRNGKAIEIDVPARLEGWRTLVPLRAVSEAFGSYVEWHDNARTVIIAD